MRCNQIIEIIEYLNDFNHKWTYIFLFFNLALEREFSKSQRNIFFYFYLDDWHIFQSRVSMLLTNVRVECIELQSDIQLEEKFAQMSLLDFYKLYLSEEKYFSFGEYLYLLEKIFSPYEAHKEIK